MLIGEEGKKKKKPSKRAEAKEEEKAVLQEEFPIRVNALKFLAEERRQGVQDISSRKIRASPDEGGLKERILGFLISKQASVQGDLVQQEGVNKDGKDHNSK